MQSKFMIVAHELALLDCRSAIRISFFEYSTLAITYDEKQMCELVIISHR